MRVILTRYCGCSAKFRTQENAGVRTIVLVSVCFVLGLATSLLWFRAPSKAPVPAETTVSLSDSTKAVLADLAQPIEIRFYSLLDPGAPASLRSFSQRAGQLLSAYQQESSGKIQLTRFDTQPNANPSAVVADGIRGFNLDQGQGCFLGVALASNGKKEVLAQLAPEWEPALEADISRAIQRLSEAAAPAGTLRTSPTDDTSVVEEVKQRLPNFASVSLEEGIRTLREAALKDFAAVVTQMQGQIQEAQQRLEQARHNSSLADQESAMKALQELQRAQTEKLGQITARSEAQIAALKQLKAGGK